MSRFICIAVLLCATAYMVAAATQRDFIFKNHCTETVWVGALNNPNKALPNNGGWTLAPGASNTIVTANDWAGRFWGRTKCSFNSAGVGHCATGDCGNKLQCKGAGGNPPVSLIEITLSGAGGLDFYDVSLVDGYNLPVTFGPVAGTFTKSSGAYSCTNAGCVADLNKSCPSVLQVKSNGTVVACKSACEHFNEDKYCCRGAYNVPSKCPPTSYSEIFKAACPNAYSYAYDDHTSTFTCSKANYEIVFCPQNAPAATSTPKTSAAATSAPKTSTHAATSTTHAATSAPKTSAAPATSAIACNH